MSETVKVGRHSRPQLGVGLVGRSWCELSGVPCWSGSGISVGVCGIRGRTVYQIGYREREN